MGFTSEQTVPSNNMSNMANDVGICVLAQFINARARVKCLFVASKEHMFWVCVGGLKLKVKSPCQFCQHAKSFSMLNCSLHASLPHAGHASCLTLRYGCQLMFSSLNAQPECLES